MRSTLHISFLLSLIIVFIFSGCEVSATINSDENEATVSYATADFQKFAVSLQGEDVGYMVMKTEEIGDSLFITQSMDWELILMGTSKTITMSVNARTSLDMNLGYLEMEMSDGTSVIKSTAVRTGITIETTVSTAGREIVSSNEFEGEFLPAFADLAAASMEWEVGNEVSFPTFDPSTGTEISI